MFVQKTLHFRPEAALKVVVYKKIELFSSLVFFFFFQNNASKLLLAIMESRHDSENAERILYNMRPKELVEVIKKAYLQGEVEFEESKEEEDSGDEEEHDAASPRNVGHNIYILAHQVCYSPQHQWCTVKSQELSKDTVYKQLRLHHFLFVVCVLPTVGAS